MEILKVCLFILIVSQAKARPLEEGVIITENEIFQVDNPIINFQLWTKNQINTLGKETSKLQETVRSLKESIGDIKVELANLYLDNEDAVKDWAEKKIDTLSSLGTTLNEKKDLLNDFLESLMTKSKSLYESASEYAADVIQNIQNPENQEMAEEKISEYFSTMKKNAKSYFKSFFDED